MNKKQGIIETERVIYSEDGSTKMGVVKEQFAKVTKRKAIDAENNKKRSASDQRHQTEKVQNVLEHFAGDDIANKANILANIVDKEGSDLLPWNYGKTYYMAKPMGYPNPA